MDSLNELIRERKRLVNVLKYGYKNQLKKEAKIQERELKGYEMKRYDYCPKCYRRTEHIKHSGMKMCKTCGYQEKD